MTIKFFRIPHPLIVFFLDARKVVMIILQISDVCGPHRTHSLPIGTAIATFDSRNAYYGNRVGHITDHAAVFLGCTSHHGVKVGEVFIIVRGRGGEGVSIQICLIARLQILIFWTFSRNVCMIVQIKICARVKSGKFGHQVNSDTVSK